RSDGDARAGIQVVQGGDECRAENQVVVAGVDGNAPLHCVSRSFADVVLCGRQLSVELPGEIIAIVGVVLEPTGFDQADEIPPQLALAAAGEGEWHYADRCSP